MQHIGRRPYRMVRGVVCVADNAKCAMVGATSGRSVFTFQQISGLWHQARRAVSIAHEYNHFHTTPAYDNDNLAQAVTKRQQSNPGAEHSTYRPVTDRRGPAGPRVLGMAYDGRQKRKSFLCNNKNEMMLAIAWRCSLLPSSAWQDLSQATRRYLPFPASPLYTTYSPSTTLPRHDKWYV